MFLQIVCMGVWLWKHCGSSRCGYSSGVSTTPISARAAFLTRTITILTLTRTRTRTSSIFPSRPLDYISPRWEPTGSSPAVPKMKRKRLTQGISADGHELLTLTFLERCPFSLRLEYCPKEIGCQPSRYIATQFCQLTLKYRASFEK